MSDAATLADVPLFATSATTEKIDAALAKAQAKIEPAPKDSTNPHFKSKYADLASASNACRGALTDEGIAITQWLLHSEDNRLHIVTRLACSGEWMQGRFSLPVGKLDAQGYGAACTYARRYALTAAVGVVADDDDDGNAASAGVEKKNPPKRQQQSRESAPAIAKRDDKVEAARAAMIDLSKKVLAVATELGWKRDIATIAGQALGKPWDQQRDRATRYTADEYEAIRRDLVVELELLEAEVKMREAAETEMQDDIDGAAE